MTTESAAPTDALVWAFHTGFAAYISTMADGEIRTDGGAERLPDGRVLFPRSPGATSTPADATDSPDAPGTPGAQDPHAELWRGTGSLQFTGHHGMLAVTLAEPAVVRADGRYLLMVDDPFEPGRRMPLATLGAATPGPSDPGTAPSSATQPGSLHFAEPLLTEDGSDLFLGNYGTGTPLAPLDLHSPALTDLTDLADLTVRPARTSTPEA